jgi:hypothetical protein
MGNGKKKRKTILLRLALTAGLFLVGRLSFGESPASAILEKTDAFRSFKSGGFSFDFTVREEGSAQDSVMRIYIKAGASDTALCRYREPASSRGRSVLVIGHTFWLFDQGMATPLRVTPRQMLSGQASAGDVTRITFSDMYSVENSEKLPGRMLLHLKAVPGRGATYDKVDLLVEERDGRPVSAACRGASGSLMKTIDYLAFDDTGGRELLASFRIKDEASGKFSMITLSNYGAETLADSKFQVQALKYLR